MSNKPLFIDIHVLQTVPPSCINRDDTGSPKTAVFGDTRRARVSSQAWKRAIRKRFESIFDAEDLGIRTKYAVNMIAASIQKKSPTVSDDDAKKTAKEIINAGLKAKKGGKPIRYEKDGTTQKTLFFIGRREVEELAELAVAQGLKKQDRDKRAKEILTPDESQLMTSIDIALFGRMVASDPDLNVDAAVQVAHALGVGKSGIEFDYYTAMDDQSPKDNAGAGMIGTIEYLSATLYRYATIDVYHLCENLGCIDVASKAVEAFIRAFVTSMPTGKQNTFANRTLPAAVVIQVRDTQPVSLVGAFEKPVYASEMSSVTELACKRLVAQAGAIDEAFGTHPVQTYVTCGAPNIRDCFDGMKGTDATLDGAVAGVSEQVKEYLSSCGFTNKD